MDVLLAENEPLVRDMLQEWMEAAGLRVAEAATAEDGLATVEQSGISPLPCWSPV
jgi:CheY-like chemotaxis protein